MPRPVKPLPLPMMCLSPLEVEGRRRRTRWCNGSRPSLASVLMELTEHMRLRWSSVRCMRLQIFHLFLHRHRLHSMTCLVSQISRRRRRRPRRSLTSTRLWGPSCSLCAICATLRLPIAKEGRWCLPVTTTTMVMMVVLLVEVKTSTRRTLKKMKSEWLASLFSSLFGALCQRGRN